MIQPDTLYKLCRASFLIMFKNWVAFWGWFSITTVRNNSVTIRAIHIQACAWRGTLDFIFKVSLTPGVGF